MKLTYFMGGAQYPCFSSISYILDKPQLEEPGCLEISCRWKGLSKCLPEPKGKPDSNLGVYLEWSDL